MMKLNNKELVEQIEEKSVGNDLQYIRLNGAVVGGLLLLALLKLLLLEAKHHTNDDR
jgi:uncharacterized membrane-anchored protein YjiN (DUF445 family)